MLPIVITCCAVLLDVTKSYYMPCNVVACYIVLVNFCSNVKCCDVFLHDMQCCYMLHCVVEFCAAALFVVMCSCMMCSVVTYCQVLLHAVQCC